MSDLNMVSDSDPYLWLEDIASERALAWAREQNERTIGELAASAEFERVQSALQDVLDADDRIPYVRRRGNYLYNFWKDSAHPRGLWRRTTIDSFRGPTPDWQVLIDVGALAAAEDENWVWQGATVLRPELNRCLVELSRGGADATVVREFDIDSLEFIHDGFTLGEAKSSVAWIDSDHIYVATDFGGDSLTKSGYPRQIREWRRGTSLSDARVVFEGKAEDVAVRAYRDNTEGYERDFVYRAIDFYNSERYLRTEHDGLVKLDVPDDARTDVHRDWLLLQIRSDWTVNETTYPAGALLATRFDDYIMGKRKIDVLFEPDEHTSLDSFSWTNNHLLINTLSDVKARIHVLTPTESGWHSEPLGGIPDVGTVTIMDTEPEHSDEYFVEVSGFTQPPSLLRGAVGDHVETLKQGPAFFNAERISTNQYFAISADGTRVPYFVVGSGKGPTLLTGYGGFEVSLTPSYSGVVGRGWLERGGTYVVANIRGGGEYGPHWHNQAIKANRTLVYEDFAAVANDLPERGICSPKTLGIHGGSNGGLLMGVMLTRYPERFGAIVSQVPLLDMRRYHNLLAGASWMAEYGNPDQESDWATLEPYSPYHNIQSGYRYPPVLFLTSTRDDRVHPGHARKMVARMRESGYDVRYHENIEGGHGAAANNNQLAFKWALVFNFLWNQLGTE